MVDTVEVIRAEAILGFEEEIRTGAMTGLREEIVGIREESRTDPTVALGEEERIGKGAVACLSDEERRTEAITGEARIKAMVDGVEERSIKKNMVEGINYNDIMVGITRKNTFAKVLLFKDGRASNSSPLTVSCSLSIYNRLKEACPGLIHFQPLNDQIPKPLAVILSFSDWDMAAKSVVSLWKLRLQGIHSWIPDIPQKFFHLVTSEKSIDSEIRKVFLEHLSKLKTGNFVMNRRLELKNASNELLEVKLKLKKRNHFDTWSQLNIQKMDISLHVQMMTDHLSEYLNGLKAIEMVICSTTGLQDDDTPLLKLGHEWSWRQMHSLIERETCRFNERLPIYAKRSQILRCIHNNQVVVLNAETGSGKSTQLVQYMVDAGFIKDGLSVVCTQPRKLPTLALYKRVSEECEGCISHDQLVGCLTNPVSQHNHSLPQILYSTDNVLLQLLLTDERLSQFGCVIIDEAHERSLSTDLLLAMLKKCLPHRPDLKVVIMSATADTASICSYFGACAIYRLVGRTFPVQYIYEASEEDDFQDIGTIRQSCPGNSRHVLHVVKVVTTIHSGKETGDVLAFLTSQAEVEWACGQSFGSSAIVLPLHGKMLGGEQQLVFQPTPVGMRKIIFATNIAETSLTIPGIKFVVDCGLAKERCIDASSGMNVLKLCKIDKSAAVQRAGRAGRTQAGVCYRLYSKLDFEAMAPHRIPEIMRVHLGIAILKLMALQVQNVKSFDFIDSPNPTAIALAIKDLLQLGAIYNDQSEKTQLTTLGWKLVKLGIDPRLGFIVIKSISAGLGMEGLVVAGLLSCSGSIFFRAGSEEEKQRSDRIKMRFCHPYGDIFTLLSVYREWSMERREFQNRWCVKNCVNAKSMRRCRDFVMEMRQCLRVGLNIVVSQDWAWSMNGPEESNVVLSKILFSSMPQNLAVFSGHDAIGYDIVGLDKQVSLHPSSSLLVYGHRPSWVTFGELLCTTREYLALVTVVEPDWLCEISSLVFHDVAALRARVMNKTVISGLSRCLLSRVCGKYSAALKSLATKVKQGTEDRCILESDFEKQELHVYATSKLMERAVMMIDEVIKREKRWLENECTERFVFQATPGRSSPVMLLGSGALVRHILMPGEYASVQVSNVDIEIEDKEILTMFDKCAGGIAGFRRDFSPGNRYRWGTVTFGSPKGAAEAIRLLDGAEMGNCLIQVRPLITSNVTERPHFPAVTARLVWSRRQMKEHAIVRCRSEEDREWIIRSCSGMLVNGQRISCRADRFQGENVIYVKVATSQVIERQLAEAMQNASNRIIEDVFVPRFPPVGQPTVEGCLEALIQEIQQFVPRTKFHANVTGRNSDYTFRALVKFDENEHEGAAQALSYLQGRALPICKPWQTIVCEEAFSSSVQCSGAIYRVLREDICDLVMALKQQNEGAELTLRNGNNGGCFVYILADSLRKVVGCKSALEKLIEGMVVSDKIDSTDSQLIFTREGLQMVKTVEMQTRTLIVCEKRSQVIRIYGSNERKNRAFQRLVRSLSQLKERKMFHEIRLRGQGRPSGLMREIVKKFGVDLGGLDGPYLSLDQRHHVLLVRGSREDLAKIEKRLEELALTMNGTMFDEASSNGDCHICLCEVEDKYSVVGCGHSFCRSCIRGQIMSAIQHREGFPLVCVYPGCEQKLLLSDFRALLTEVEEVELGNASLSSFISSNHGKYRFCTTPDCPSVYAVTEQSHMFACGACSIRLCTSCHIEFHAGLTCHEYEEFKQDPDASLKMWRKGKVHVQSCPSCGRTIEKVEGCNHVLCKCNTHLCWLCCSSFKTSEDCYSHMQNEHGGYV